MLLKIVYVDNHLLVVSKPAGMLTQPNDTAEESAECQAKAWIKNEYKKTGNVFLHAVHRLDRPVEGIVLFARTSKALTRLNAAMREKSCRKIYVAEVEGCIAANEGQLRHFLTHDSYQAKVVKQEESNGKEAILKYKVLEKHPYKTMLEIELETGRYHQIRVQLSTIGHPILGDKKYGSKTVLEGGKIQLCHKKLEIHHPITGELKSFEST